MVIIIHAPIKLSYCRSMWQLQRVFIRVDNAQYYECVLYKHARLLLCRGVSNENTSPPIPKPIQGPTPAPYQT